MGSKATIVRVRVLSPGPCLAAIMVLAAAGLVSCSLLLRPDPAEMMLDGGDGPTDGDAGDASTDVEGDTDAESDTDADRGDPNDGDPDTEADAVDADADLVDSDPEPDVADTDPDVDPGPGGEVIAWDDFEAGWGGGDGWAMLAWFHEGTVQVGDGGRDGGRALVLAGSLGYADRSVVLGSRRPTRVEMWARAQGLMGGERVDVVAISRNTGDGERITTLDRFVLSDVFRLVICEIPAEANDPVGIGFDAELSSGRVYIDDLTVVYDP